MKSALIMEGGAMRGMFTCGVIDVLLKNSIAFEGAAGISAGAVFGCNYKSRQIGRSLRYNKKYCSDKRYCSLKSLIKTGDIYGTEFCYDTLPNKLDLFDKEAFRLNPMRFFVGATDVNTGQCAYHECKDGGTNDMLWLRASASMPLVSKVVHADGLLLLDGGIADAVPYAFMRLNGYEKQVIVLTQPRGYRKQAIRHFALIKLMLRKYPELVRALSGRADMYNAQMNELDALEGSGEALIIRPPEPLNIGHIEKRPEELERVYRIGEREAEKRLSDIEQFLKA